MSKKDLPYYYGSVEVNKKCICGTGQLMCPEDREMNDCEFCLTLDPYDPCPVYGYGCGELCGCCTPEQQEAAKL